MREPDSAHAVHAQFTTTHWSVVVAAGDSSTPTARPALEQLCRAYWYSLYAFVSRLGHSPEDAQDLTQGFFAYLLAHHLVARADPQAGHFRSFLLASLKHFLAHEHERATALKRGGGQPVLSLDQFDPEERYALEPAAAAATPDAIFDQRWALLQVENALSRLRAEYAASGRGPLFDLLKDPYRRYPGAARHRRGLTARPRSAGPRRKTLGGALENNRDRCRRGRSHRQSQ